MLINLVDFIHLNELFSVLGPSYIDDLIKKTSATLVECLGDEALLYQVGAFDCSIGP